MVQFQNQLEAAEAPTPRARIVRGKTVNIELVLLDCEGLAAKLQLIRVKRLKVVAGAHKATPTRELKPDLYPSYKAYLNNMLAASKHY